MTNIIEQCTPSWVHAAVMHTMSCLLLMDTETLSVFLILPVTTQLLQR